MNAEHDKTIHPAVAMTMQELARLGTGEVAYMRRMSADEFASRFGGSGELPDMPELWALFAADGQPILLADGEAAARLGAQENNLATVSIH